MPAPPAISTPQAAAPPQCGETASLHDRYLLITFIRCYQDDDGSLWLEQGWHHDLVEHLRYLKNFTLCAPLHRKGVEPDEFQPLLRLDVPTGVQMNFEPLPRRTTLANSLTGLPRTAVTFWRTIGKADIVHSAIIGWPYPYGWIVNPFAVLRRKGLVLIVESSWKAEDLKRDSLHMRLWDALHQFMAQWTSRRATVAFYSQSGYRDSIHRGTPDRAYVTPAVWINEEDVISPAEAQRSWSTKLAQPVRLIFAARLIEGKGVYILLAALRILEARGTEARIDIIGEGLCLEDCREAAATLTIVHLNVLGTVPYGAPFFELIRGYHALLIPSITDEQPRVVFDANAQALPVIASDTPGLRPHVQHDQTGWLLPAGDPEALAAQIQKATASRAKLCAMGMAALDATQGHTHVGMHRSRLQVLRKYFA